MLTGSLLMGVKPLRGEAKSWVAPRVPVSWLERAFKIAAALALARRARLGVGEAT
eukprot:CAMPEP_0115271794 /NCGR_PEP_ID=MMETSP0270-20121206/54289_1 /TAXON_ID=71861 /ORGANISM="Scrippsiella trochoidea, Strain CCMP3099" /LENGTH=54 /DNA_ID=CAMNT_0002688177 /DNA_START=68 /DNA_END=232 /DNA_ORIENTATION=+